MWRLARARVLPSLGPIITSRRKCRRGPGISIAGCNWVCLIRGGPGPSAQDSKPGDRFRAFLWAQTRKRCPLGPLLMPEVRRVGPGSAGPGRKPVFGQFLRGLAHSTRGQFLGPTKLRPRRLLLTRRGVGGGGRVRLGSVGGQ